MAITLDISEDRTHATLHCRAQIQAIQASLDDIRWPDTPLVLRQSGDGTYWIGTEENLPLEEDAWRAIRSVLSDELSTYIDRESSL